MAKMPLVVLLLPLIITAVTTEALPDAVVSFNATSPSKSEGKQSSESAAEKGVLRQEETFFTGQRLVNPYVFIQETASRDHRGDDGERSGRYVQVRVLKFESNQVKEKCHFNPLFIMQYSRESSDYIYGPGDIGGGNPIVFPDQEDIEEEKEEYKVADRGATTYYM